MSNSHTVLRELVARIEDIEAQKAALNDDAKGVYAEVKVTGFNPKVVRKMIARRKMDPGARRESDNLLAEYEAAMGMSGEAEDLA